MKANEATETYPMQFRDKIDEYHKRQILRILKDNGCSQRLQEKTEKWIEERLKSLRSRYTWKPSNEQMHALFEAHKQMSADYHMPLLSLYNDLKKLREEYLWHRKRLRSSSWSTYRGGSMRR